MKKMEKIGQEIKKHRKKAGMTQKELASKIGKTESTIRKYEKAQIEIPINVIDSIASVLKMTPFELIGVAYFDMEVENLTEELKKHSAFDKYLSELGYSLSEFQDIKFREEDIELMDFVDAETLEPFAFEGTVQRIESYNIKITKENDSAIFSNVEIEEIKKTIEDIVEFKILKKIYENRWKNKQKWLYHFG